MASPFDNNNNNSSSSELQDEEDLKQQLQTAIDEKNLMAQKLEDYQKAHARADSQHQLELSKVRAEIQSKMMEQRTELSDTLQELQGDHDSAMRKKNEEFLRAKNALEQQLAEKTRVVQVLEDDVRVLKRENQELFTQNTELLDREIKKLTAIRCGMLSSRGDVSEFEAAKKVLSDNLDEVKARETALQNQLRELRVRTTPADQIRGQLDALNKFITAQYDKDIRLKAQQPQQQAGGGWGSPSPTGNNPNNPNNRFISFRIFNINPCFNSRKNTELCQLLNNNTDVNFSKIVKSHPTTGELELNSQFELALHGTSREAAEKIMCKGFDTALRSPIVSSRLVGEYFGTWDVEGCHEAEKYDKGALLAVLIIKAGPVKRDTHNTSTIVVNNPATHTTYCVPIAYASSSSIRCSECSPSSGWGGGGGWGPASTTGAATSTGTGVASGGGGGGWGSSSTTGAATSTGTAGTSSAWGKSNS